MSKIFGRWSDFNGMLSSYQEDAGYEYNEDGKYEYVRKVKPLEGPVPTEDELLFASYGGGAYEGDASVFFKKDGKLFEVGGSHCSCNGLEGQWNPTEVTFPALAMRVAETEKVRADGGYYYFLHDHDDEAVTAFAAMVKANT